LNTKTGTGLLGGGMKKASGMSLGKKKKIKTRYYELY
jgi:hypothetical protein